METHLAVGVALLPVSELLSRILVQVSLTIRAARNVLLEKDNFACLADYLEKLEPVLSELQLKCICNTTSVRNAIESIEKEISTARDLAETFKTKSKFYLFLNCRSVVKQLQQITTEIGRALGRMPLANLELSGDCKYKTNLLIREMQGAEFKTALGAEEIAQKIEQGLRDYKQSNNFSNDLLMQIAKAVGIDLSPSTLKQELEQLKKEKEEAELQKNQAEALQLEQIATLLSWADVAYSPTEREKLYHDKRMPLGKHPFPPLHSFYCPITREVMEDPVEILSGHTFEREAIQKWFSEGHTLCPVSQMELENLDLKPNIILRRSINEWKDRNIQIQLTSMGPKLRSEDEEIVLATLDELYKLCEAKSIHRHWIAAEGLVPVLGELLKLKKSTVRKKTLATLAMLVKDNLDNKVRACEAGVVAYAVRSLAREVLEAKQAVALLLELSKETKLCKQLSKTQGCILLLVTLTNSEIQKAAEDAKSVLENLAKVKEQNVVLMAEANYFKPLVECLNEGSNTTQIVMANTISRMELTDQSRLMLIQLGILPPLVKMISGGILELKSAALGALQNLSKCSQNRDPMVKAGLIKLLLELLFTPKSVLVKLKEQAADVLANLSASTDLAHDSTNDLLGNISEPNETIYHFLSLLHLSGGTMQKQLLRSLIGMSRPPRAQSLRIAMREAGAVEQLVNLYMISPDSEVQICSLKVILLLTEDGGGDALAKEITIKPLTALINLFMESTHDDVKATIMGILNNIPVDNKSTTELMVESGFLPIIINILQTASSKMPVKKALLESTVGVLLRFTLPSSLPLQQLIAESGVIPMLLELLKSGTSLTKCRAAKSLAQLSESTVKQTRHVKKVKRFWCVTPPVEDVCKVHGGVCSVEKSFCLVEAQAIPVLVKTLEEQDPAAVESALAALATLLFDEFWEKGADAIAEEMGVNPIIRLLTNETPKVQEISLWILERLFRKSALKVKYGNAAQMALISLTQDGTNNCRHYAARILAHLNILQEQSSYF